MIAGPVLLRVSCSAFHHGLLAALAPGHLAALALGPGQAATGSTPSESMWRRLFGDPQETVDWVHHHGLRILVILVVAFLLVSIFRLLAHRIIAYASGRRDLPREQQLRTLVTVIDSTATALVLIVAGLQILQQLDIAIGPLIGTAGIAGLAIGFGAQTLVKDVITGFFILLDDQYRVGDTVRAAGVQGKVERLTLRRTILRDADGTVHFIPNSELHVVSNLTRDWTLATLLVAVHYRENSDRVIQVLKEAGDEVHTSEALREKVLSDPIVPGIERVSGDEVDYLVQIQTVPGAQFEVLRTLRSTVKRHLEQAGIEAWYPQVSLPGRNLTPVQ